MYEPDVSIITPTFNVVENNQNDDFLLQIALLDKQTYPNIEHIIIDNASKDGTDELLKEYKNSGYISFLSEPDRGKFDAMNKGILRAKGKYVAFLSCDDCYHDIKAIEDIILKMESENADYCLYKTYCVMPDRTAFEYQPSIHNIFQVPPCARQAIIFNRKTLQEIGGFDTKFSLIADYDLILRLVLARKKGIQVDRNLLTYNLGMKVAQYSIQSNAECSHIFYKNYKQLYPITQEQIDRIVTIGEIPETLLNKFATYFPNDEVKTFFQKCITMSNIRKESYETQRLNERQQRNL